MIVYKVTPEEWSRISEKAHLVAFNEKRPSILDRYNFALVVADHDHIYGYTTVIEMDKDTAYMQHGGAMPNVKGTTSTLKVYRLLVEWLKLHYKRISTRIQNKNRSMLKLALSQDLLIDGVHAYEGEVFLSLGWGF